MDSAVAAADSKSSRRKIFFGLSAGSLAIAGVLAAFAVLSGGDSWKAVGTALLVFSLNILVLISFSSVHDWLKLSQRIVSSIAVFGSIVFIWVSVPYNFDSNGHVVPSTLRVLEDTSFALWSLVAALSLLCLFSLCWKLISQSAALKLCYVLSFGFTLGSAALATLLGSISSIDGYRVVSDPLGLLAGALAILAAASSLIVLIAALVERSSRRRLRAERVDLAFEGSPEDLRSALRALAESGELVDILLRNPDSLSRLRAALMAAEGAVSEGPRDPNSPV